MRITFVLFLLFSAIVPASKKIKTSVESGSLLLPHVHVFAIVPTVPPYPRDFQVASLGRQEDQQTTPAAFLDPKNGGEVPHKSKTLLRFVRYVDEVPWLPICYLQRESPNLERLKRGEVPSILIDCTNCSLPNKSEFCWK